MYTIVSKWCVTKQKFIRNPINLFLCKIKYGAHATHNIQCTKIKTMISPNLENKLVENQPLKKSFLFFAIIILFACASVKNRKIMNDDINHGTSHSNTSQKFHTYHHVYAHCTCTQQSTPIPTHDDACKTKNGLNK